MVNDPTTRPATAGTPRGPVLVLMILAVNALAAGCVPPAGEAAEEGSSLPSDRTDQARLATAVATLRPASNRDAHGVVRFETAGEDAIRVTSSFTGLEPGVHAYHIHVNGDCSAPDAESAGPHFNLQDPGADPSHATRILGDLGEVVADISGLADHEALLPEARLSQGDPRSILGRSVIIHERGNDPESPPDGDAGTRIGCGIVGIVER